MDAIGSCPVCTEEVTEDSDYCPHCGTLFSAAGNVVCDTHPDKVAEGVCVICGTVVCVECSSVTMGRFLCREHSLVELRQDWAKVFEATDITEAELVKSLLDSNGIPTQAVNFGSIGFIWDGGGDSAVSRSNISKPAKLFVPIPKFTEAVRMVEEWSSADEESEEPNA